MSMFELHGIARDIGHTNPVEMSFYFKWDNETLECVDSDKVLVEKIRQYANFGEEDHEYSMDEEDLGVDERAENYDFKPHSSSSDEDTEVEDEEPTNVHKRKKKYVRTKLQKFPEFRPEVDMASPIFKPGTQFKKAVREYAIQQGKDVYFEKNDSNRVRAKCKGVNCPWCPRTNKNRFASSKWLAEKDLDQFKMHDKWAVSAFQQTVGREKTLVISRDKAYRAWMFATKEIEGTYQEHKHSFVKVIDTPLEDPGHYARNTDPTPHQSISSATITPSSQPSNSATMQRTPQQIAPTY
ncbi:hypothetical protein F8388_008017 [Cannabis sativa]|uniref:Transposase MuDR plant domain-containing protein n=1 Tax=Cannabis sativa TaxID=3483 RepID=A0A7J6H802_CANSA|nr:hypothetical protein F8388_008017 [Cannabis sativa]